MKNFTFKSEWVAFSGQEYYMRALRFSYNIEEEMLLTGKPKSYKDMVIPWETNINPLL